MPPCNIDPAAWIPLVIALTTLTAGIGAAAVGVIQALRGNTTATQQHTAAITAQQPPAGQ